MSNKTSSQKAVIALEVEEQLAREARTRRLAGLKQNQSAEPLTNEFPNGNDAPLGNCFPNGNDAPLGNCSIRESAAQAASAVGTNPQYVKYAKKIRRLAPELLKPILDGIITIPQAKKIATMPPQHRIIVVELIKTGEAKNIALAAHYISQRETTSKEDQADFLSSGWTNAMYKLRIFFNSLQRQGGIAKLSRRWSRKGRQGYLSELCEVRDAMNKCIEYLEKELGK